MSAPQGHAHHHQLITMMLDPRQILVHIGMSPCICSRLCFPGPCTRVSRLGSEPIQCSTQAELHCLQRQHTSLLSEADVLERQVSNLKELLARAQDTEGVHRGGMGATEEERVLQPLDTNAQVGD